MPDKEVAFDWSKVHTEVVVKTSSLSKMHNRRLQETVSNCFQTTGSSLLRLVRFTVRLFNLPNSLKFVKRDVFEPYATTTTSQSSKS